MTTFSLIINAGTIVQGRKSGLVTLKADCYIGDADRMEDGSFKYSVGLDEYYCSAGCCRFIKNDEQTA